jgi:Transposase DDE domain
MHLTRIPQRVSNLLAPLAACFPCPQGHHFRIFCWLLVSLLVIEGGATLTALTRLMPRSLAYWTVLRMLRSGYWDATTLVTELGLTTLRSLPPPADGVLHLTGDLTVLTKTGEQQPLARKTRLNEYGPYLFGQSLVLLIAQWGRCRIPVAARVVDPKIAGHQNILFRQMLDELVPPSWATQVIVEADAAFAAQATLQLIQQKGWGYVFGLARTWKLNDGTALRQLARHTPKSCYRRVASYKPDRRRQDYWVFRRPASVRHLGDVTILLSKRRHNDGPKQIKLIVTNLKEAKTGDILSYQARRWGIEVTFKELKSGLHWGQMQVTKQPERVRHALLLPVLAYLLLLRLYGRELSPTEGFTFWQLKRRFLEDLYQEQQNRSDRRWQKKLDQSRAAA